MRNRIAAVVPCYNRREKTLRFLDAFLAQTYPNLDLILVDSDSHDGTANAVKTRAPGTIVLKAHREDYWTAATNVGVKYALQHCYDYILTINDDCLIAPDYVETLVNLAEKYDLPILGSRIEHLDQPGLLCGIGISPNWVTSLFSHRYKDEQIDRLPAHIQDAEVLEADTLPGNGTLIHRSVFETVGIYDERHLPHYLSDVELIMRAKCAGFAIGVTPSAIIRDDFPTPAQRALKDIKRGGFWAEFRYAFFHKRSGGKLSSRVYIILNYCPWYLMPIAFGMCGIAIVNWSAKFLWKQHQKLEADVSLSKIQSLD